MTAGASADRRWRKAKRHYPERTVVIDAATAIPGPRLINAEGSVTCDSRCIVSPGRRPGSATLAPGGLPRRRFHRAKAAWFTCDGGGAEGAMVGRGLRGRGSAAAGCAGACAGYVPGSEDTSTVSATPPDRGPAPDKAGPQVPWLQLGVRGGQLVLRFEQGVT